MAARGTRFRLAAALPALVGIGALLALAATGHDRLVTVAAFTALLHAVLHATASALGTTEDHARSERHLVEHTGRRVGRVEHVPLRILDTRTVAEHRLRVRDPGDVHAIG